MLRYSEFWNNFICEDCLNYLSNMKYLTYAFLFFLLATTFACEQNNNSKKESKNSLKETNSSAPGFNQESSDLKAIDIADEVMVSMGGRKAYDETQFLAWNFFGSRKLWWDKHSGDVRIESLKEDFKVKMNIHTMEGEVWKDSLLLTQPDSLKKYLERGKNIWINDSYWLVMPYKLKDSGVTLKYVGEENSDTLNADILELTFDQVGKTPENKYHVYVDKNDKLVTQWSFYAKASDEKPRFVTPWQDYKKFDKILLSGDRGKYQLNEIRVDPEISNELNARLN